MPFGQPESMRRGSETAWPRTTSCRPQPDDDAQAEISGRARVQLCETNWGDGKQEGQEEREAGKMKEDGARA